MLVFRLLTLNRQPRRFGLVTVRCGRSTSRLRETLCARERREKRDTREKRDPKFEIQGSKFKKPRPVAHPAFLALYAPEMLMDFFSILLDAWAGLAGMLCNSGKNERELPER